MVAFARKVPVVCAALLVGSTLARGARAQSSILQAVDILVEDYGGPKTLTSQVSGIQVAGLCDARLRYDPTPFLGVAIAEVSGDRGPPQRKSAPCSVRPAFTATKEGDLRRFEEQTAYYWSNVSREYARSNLFVQPPGWPLGPIPRTLAPVQPNVVTRPSFDAACFPASQRTDGCMRVWPVDGAKIHLLTGKVTPYLVTHEFGHHAAGYVFGHMDVFGFALPAATGDCAKLAFQEALADVFSDLVLHHARYANLVGGGAGPVATGDTARWPIACAKPEDAYATARPLREAFQQALWGTDPTRTVQVDWGSQPGVGLPKSPQVANAIMARAFTYALAMNRGHRIDQLAASMLEWLAANEPRRVGPIRTIFAAHGFAPRLYGEACTAHEQCVSFRCDNRPGAGCVALDGMAGSGQPCTTHQQCQSRACLVPAGKIRGTCR